MQTIEIITLVDITRSGAGRLEPNSIKVGQQANFNSLIQTIGLRSNVDWSDDPKKHSGRLPDSIDGSATHWIWRFTVERDSVFQKDSDSIGHLVDDLNGVPVVTELEESVDISPQIFSTRGRNQNIWFKII